MNVLEKIFKPKSETLSVEVVEPIDERRQELATVQVRDIKQYLLDEYERSKQLYEQNQKLKKALLEAEDVKVKYDATLVTLDEYKNRLDRCEKEFADYDKEFQRCRQETEDVRDELNNYKIKFQRASITKEELRAEAVNDIKRDIVRAIMEHKGNLSKTKAVEIVKNVS